MPNTVISQNYKAGFGTVSNTAITAVTRSGTNTLSGDAFIDYAGSSQIAYSPFEREKEAAGQSVPSAKQSQFGASVGGAIVQDKVHYFVETKARTTPFPRSCRPPTWPA